MAECNTSKNSIFNPFNGWGKLAVTLKNGWASCVFGAVKRDIRWQN